MRPREAAALLFLAGGAMTDLKERRIRLWFAACFAAIGLVCGAMDFGRTMGLAAADTVWTEAGGMTEFWPLIELIMQIGLNVLPGSVVLALAVVSGGKIGGGDGIALIVLGLFSGIQSASMSLLCALIFSSLFGGVVLIVTRRRKFSYPFLPFLFAGYLLSLLV